MVYRSLRRAAPLLTRVRAAHGRGEARTNHSSYNGLYKAEIIHRRGPWRSLEAVDFATLECGWTGSTTGGSWSPIGNIPPAEAEERRYYTMLEQPAMAAIKSNGLRTNRGGSCRLPLGPCPSLHRLRSQSPGLVHQLRSYYGRVRLPASVHHRLRLLTFPMRTRAVCRG